MAETDVEMGRWVYLVGCLVMLGSGLAVAQPAGPDSGDAQDEKPWAKSVTAEEKATAQEFLAQGNALFVESRHREALEVYRKALDSWDHPAIRFNIARALINLDRPLEAYENIRLAVRHGRAPLPGLYDEAKNYERLLRGQIGSITIRCEQSGVRVTVDGQQHFDCPVETTIELLPGPHKVLAEKSGFLTFSRDLSLLPAAREPVEITLVTLEDASVTRRRWASWKPWAVVGSGVAVTGLGVALELLARSTRDGYGEDLARLCPDTPCVESELPDSVRGAYDRAQVEHAIGVSGIAIGSAAVLSGLALVYLNRPRTFLQGDAIQPTPGGTQVVPAVSADSVGAALIHRF